MKELPCEDLSYPLEGSDKCDATRKCEIDPSIILLERVQEKFAGHYSCQGMNLAGWGSQSESKELVVYC